MLVPASTQPSAGMIAFLPVRERCLVLSAKSVAVRSVMPTFALKARTAVYWSYIYQLATWLAAVFHQLVVTVWAAAWIEVRVTVFE